MLLYVVGSYLRPIIVRWALLAFDTAKVNLHVQQHLPRKALAHNLQKPILVNSVGAYYSKVWVRFLRVYRISAWFSLGVG